MKRLVFPVLVFILSPSPLAAQDSYCSSIDRDQSQLNELVSGLKQVYPLTVSYLRSCAASAKTGSDMTACMATAGTMAHCDYDDWQTRCGYSTLDFVQRLATITQRRSDLIERKPRHRDCVLQIPDDTEGL